MMALDNHFLLPHQVQPCFDWDPQTFGLAADHQLHERRLGLFNSVGSWMPSESPTGYLQDAVAECSDRRKKRRKLPPPPPPPPPVHDSVVTEDLQGLLQGFWNPDFCEDPLNNSSYMLQDHIINIPDCPFNMLLNCETQLTSPHPQQDPLPSFSSQGDSSHSTAGLTISKDDCHSNSSPPVSSTVVENKKPAMGLVYPFDMVKPGALDGDVTLADINEKILMRPKRPVRHPVGEYACTPCFAAANQLTLSGKAVMSLIRIHTQGRGTVTIVRTRG